MSNPGLPYDHDPPAPPPGLRTSDKTTRKNFPLKILCNLLISLDSDEEIQGNPRKSNPDKRGSLKQNGGRPRKPKRTDRAMGRRIVISQIQNVFGDKRTMQFVEFDAVVKRHSRVAH